MSELEASAILKHFADFPEPRDPRGVRHKLLDILCISILAVMCRANTFTEIHQYGESNETWLSGFLELPFGIPSQDTFERVFALLNPAAWQMYFYKWTQSLVVPELTEGEDEVLAIDGKTARRSYSASQAALHTVTVWSSQYDMVLGQEHVAEKSNEITAIPILLQTTNPAGAVVTIDAMGTQKDIAWLIREQHAHYVLALKDNHPKLYEDVKWLFAHGDSLGWKDLDYSYAHTLTKAHGREEHRECWVLSVADIDMLDNKTAWRDLQCVVRVRNTCKRKGVTSQEDRFFITSLPLDAGRIMRSVRYHWAIENGLHWTLDVAFDEDRSRIRTGYAQANFVALRHLALSLLKQDKSLKVGIEAKRARAGWDRTYLLKLLAG
jgi:predicted transposase YbfD/YdcC